jgi:CheY-like chemotaxis protein
MKALKNILIVDDSESDHVITRFAIQEHDPKINTVSAYDGREGLNIIATSKVEFDLILLDINMPGMNGHEFLAEFAKSNHPAAVVVMLTSSDQESDKQKCLHYQFVIDYYNKPLEAEDLIKLESTL